MNAPLTSITSEPFDDPHAGIRSPLNVPTALEPFSKAFHHKFKAGDFLGEDSKANKSRARAQLGWTRSYAKFLMSSKDGSFEPQEEAVNRTVEAAKAFFALSYSILAENCQQFPLAGRNKCIGIVAVPRSKLVLIAISQDRIPANDTVLRRRMLEHINRLNDATSDRVFELVFLPREIVGNFLQGCCMKARKTLWRPLRCD